MKKSPTRAVPRDGRLGLILEWGEMLLVVLVLAISMAPKL